MYELINISEKKCTNKYAKNFYILTALLLIVFLLYIFFMYVYNTQKNTLLQNSLPIVENISLTISKEEFNKKKSELLLIKNGTLLNDEQYNNIILSLIHISEPTSPLYFAFAVFCFKK